MLIGEGEAGSGRLDVEQGPRAGDDRIGGGLLADPVQAGDRHSLVAPGDLSRAAIEPTGPDVDLDRLDSDHCHVPGSFADGSRGLAFVIGALDDWNVCSVLTRSCIEQVFDVKPASNVILHDGCVI